MKTAAKKQKPSPWYLRDQMSSELKPDFEARQSVSNAKKTYLISILGIFFFILFLILDIGRYQSGALQLGTIYFYLMFGHFSFLLYAIPFYIYRRNKKAIRTGTYQDKIFLTILTLGILCLSLISIGTLALVERGSLMIYGAIILLINLVFSLSHIERLVTNLICFFATILTILAVQYDLGWVKICTNIVEFAGITLPAYLMATYQYNIVSREFVNEKLVEQKKQELEKEQEKSEALLLNILPLEIAKELKEEGKASARHHQSVTLLFSDFVSFSSISAEVSPQALVNELDACFRGFDKIIGNNKLEKIKTVGDAYFALVVSRNLQKTMLRM